MMDVMPARILGLATALPPHRLAQAEACAFAREVFGEAFRDPERLLEIFPHAGVEERRLAMPLDWLRAPRGFAERNEAYRREALALAAEAAARCLAGAACSPREVDHVLLVSSTGLSTPSLDALLLNRLGLRPDVKRTPVWGLGCAGGAAGLSRAADFARAAPGERVLLVVVELCSLTFQRRDATKSNLVATALFGDGAAAALVGSEGKGPEVMASRSTTWAGTLDVMGWEVNDDGLRVLFSRDIPAIVRDLAKPAVLDFLASRGLSLSGLRHVIAHPGGPKVMAAYEEALGLPADGMRHAREVLRRHGNMSAPSVLFVLERFLSDPAVRPGDLGLLTALGPGFSSELVLLKFS